MDDDPLETENPNQDSTTKPRDPMHGVTLEMIITRMVKRHGWQGLADRIPIRCFSLSRSVKSSLTFLRKTPWDAKNWRIGMRMMLDALTWSSC